MVSKDAKKFFGGVLRFYFYYVKRRTFIFLFGIIKKKNMGEFIKLNIIIKAVYIINICV